MFCPLNVCDLSSGQVFSLTTNALVLPADNFMGRGMELMKPSLPELLQAVPQYSNDPIRKDLPEHLRVYLHHCCKL